MIRHGDLLSVEMEFYLENKEEYLAKFLNKVVLIKGRRLVGVYSDYSSARVDGSKIFGKVPMLIHLVTEEVVESVPILGIGRNR